MYIVYDRYSYVLVALHCRTVGVQMAAINFQYQDAEMDWEKALFRDNEGLGYVLKPAFLCDQASSSGASACLQLRIPIVYQSSYEDKQSLCNTILYMYSFSRK